MVVVDVSYRRKKVMRTGFTSSVAVRHHAGVLYLLLADHEDERKALLLMGAGNEKQQVSIHFNI